MGFRTGGLAGRIDQNVKELGSIEGVKIDNQKILSVDQFDNIKIGKNRENQPDQTIYPAYFHLVISICYALFLSLGSIAWFILMAFLIVRFRKRINIMVISVFIKSLGFVLGLFGAYFGYQAARMFF
jgi:hypothetical protein